MKLFLEQRLRAWGRSDRVWQGLSMPPYLVIYCIKYCNFFEFSGVKVFRVSGESPETQQKLCTFTISPQQKIRKNLGILCCNFYQSFFRKEWSRTEMRQNLLLYICTNTRITKSHNLFQMLMLRYALVNRKKRNWQRRNNTV